ncbi:hypothetical protein VTN49DRAFT_6558 [Thermomyces lanuginosus]|uniref:uncharacterized protein n=1 Tax=Thermomyces lanuginosus TaxID=5541 RepID=UPI003742D03F
MSPSLNLDSDFDASAKSAKTTLLLSPPSLSSHPEKLQDVLQIHPRQTTDLQMLDRLASGLVTTPSAKYDNVILLADADGSYTDSRRLLANRRVLGDIVNALKPGGRLQSQTGSLVDNDDTLKKELVLAGLIEDGTNGFTKPDYGQEAVPLRLPGKKRNGKAASTDQAGQSNESGIANGGTNGEQKQPPAGVGFVDFTEVYQSSGPGTGQDSREEELIDEDELLDENDYGQQIIIPPECRPKAGKRRRACKDCTCGLAQKLEAEDAARRANADKALNDLKLKQNELTEVDFTVKGKVGSCGNCALGDAFRCDGCPYIGLPPFKPGEEVTLLNNDVQL